MKKFNVTERQIVISTVHKVKIKTQPLRFAFTSYFSALRFHMSIFSLPSAFLKVNKLVNK